LKLRRGSFERRLLLALALFSLIPSLILLSAGTYLLARSVALHTSPAAWEQVRGSGRELLDLADRSDDTALVAAAAEHREVLDFSLQQSRLWEYLNERVLRMIPFGAVLLAAFLVWLAVRSARGIARELARPIRELVGWSELVARAEPLPPASPATEDSGEFVVLRDAFRKMADELAVSRERALEAERARTWVSMARGVAHELKNSLTPLQLALRAMERGSEADPALREPLEVASAESMRLEELARSFAHFGRLPEGPMSEIDLAEQLDYLLRTHLPPNIEYHLDAPVDLPRVHAHHDALSRAFANLLLNSAEAMADTPGTVSVELSSHNGVVRVRVMDNGPGVPVDQLRRIWEPDFTTKSRGTGLGLALVRQTVQAHGGSIQALNRPEGGAEFRVELPLRGEARS
jgi:nitrogen fixation/metabolism regulation signal transduction histidine kinase